MYKYNDYEYSNEEIVDENGNEVLPTDNDYEYYKAEYENTHNPLSDDYIPEKYRQEDW